MRPFRALNVLQHVCWLWIGATLLGVSCGDNARIGGDAGLSDAPGGDGGSLEEPVIEETLFEACGSIPVSFDDWESCYRKRKCEWEVGCLPLNTYRDEQECLDHGDAFEGGRRSAELRERARAVEQGRASINVEAFSRCLIETNKFRCNTAFTNALCKIRFTGSIEDEQPCLTDIECASPGAECQADCRDACCVGTCQPKFQLGDTCDQSESCEPGLQCYRNCYVGDIGTPCQDDGHCDPNAWCDEQKGICRADFSLGADCDNPLQCGGQASCVGLSVTSADPGKCVRIAEAGDRCDYFCYGNLSCAGGICRELPGLGEACGQFGICGGVNTVCRNRVCVMRGGMGAPCNSREDCLAGLFCTSEVQKQEPTPTCVPRRSEGEPCTDPRHCESYLCSGTIDQPGVCLLWSDTCPVVAP